MTTLLEKQTNSFSALKRDVKVLGHLLGDVLVHQGGKELLNTVEQIRDMTKSLRKTHDRAIEEKLRQEIKALDPTLRKQVIRAFSIYFQLVNIAEQNHRIRRRKEYQLQEAPERQAKTLENAVNTLKQNNIPSDQVQVLVDKLLLELVVTAHPTEASRRSVLNSINRISDLLKKLDSISLTNRERTLLTEELSDEISILWQTDELRHRKPTVMDEVSNGLFYFDETLFQVLPDIHQYLEDILYEQYPNEAWKVPNFLRFGSWIGGDRDGNPHVTSDVTWATLVKQRELTIKKYKEGLNKLLKKLSYSSNRVEVSNELLQSIVAEEEHIPLNKKWQVSHEVYRCKLAIMIEKLNRVGTNERGYKNIEEFIHDLSLIHNSIKGHHPNSLRELKRLIRQAKLFGFHLASLDIRNHSGEHEAAIDELLRKVNIHENYKDLKEDEKVHTLISLLKDPRPLLVHKEEYTEQTQELLGVFSLIRKAHKEFGERSIEVYLISMTRDSSDILEVLLLAKEAGLFRIHADGSIHSSLTVAPLLETIDDLSRGPAIMKKLFDIDFYREHLECRGNMQEVMLGYSDGSKDGGTMTANWKLYNAQQQIHEVAKPYNIRLKFFHGRGGALGRGGGPLSRSILSQPAETLGDGIKITEQGEVLSSRYASYDIAYRSLEQAVSTLITASANVSTEAESNHLREPEWEEAVSKISDSAYSKYQSLVFGNPDFLTYFKESTPLPEIGSLNIGSRPMSRKKSNNFEDLRAIPWVFAWTQSRQLLPAWYGAGTGLATFEDENKTNLPLLQTMYEEWPFFKSLIDNLQMALMKADLLSAKEYVQLVKNQDIGKRIFHDLTVEYNKTKNMILAITGQQELMDHLPNIKQSIALRNPYVDPLNFFQVELIAQLRKEEIPNPELLQEVLLTINGIASGLRNTG